MGGRKRGGGGEKERLMCYAQSVLLQWQLDNRYGSAATTPLEISLRKLFYWQLDVELFMTAHSAFIGLFGRTRNLKRHLGHAIFQSYKLGSCSCIGCQYGLFWFIIMPKLKENESMCQQAAALNPYLWSF